VAALWETVSRNTQASDVALVASGWFPGDPGETWRLRRGATLDRTYLLYRWLIEAGIDGVTWVWVRPRQAGRVAAGVPSLQAFSDAAIEISGGPPAFLFPGDDLDTITEPLAARSGAPCLTPGQGLTHLPVAPPEERGIEQTVVCRIDAKGNAAVTESIIYRGRDARALRAWRRLTAKDIRNAVESMVRGVDAKAKNIRFEVDDVSRNTPSLTLRLEYLIPRVADVRPTLCSLQPPWLRYDATAVGRQQRELPLFWDTPRQDTVRVTVAVPRHFRLAAMPEEHCFSGVIVRLETTQKTDGSRYSFALTYTRPALDAGTDRYDELKTCQQRRAQFGRQFWVWRQRAAG
jgi:hypothetical protein